MTDDKKAAIQECIDKWQDINKRVRASISGLLGDTDAQGRIKYMQGIITQNEKYIAMAQSKISD